MGPESAATLNDAIGTQPMWLQAWVMVLVLTHVLALVFVVAKTADGWRVRGEPIAIVLSFVAAAIFMSWLFEQYGYVRLLGLGHLVFWTPAYAWVLMRRKQIGTDTLFGKYVLVYLAVAGSSLVIDVIDVVRYFAGAWLSARASFG